MKRKPRKGMPTSIKVGRRTYKIYYYSKRSDMYENSGGTWFPEGYIHILDEGQTRDELFQILLHEILHAISYEYNIQSILKLKIKTEEKTVNTLAVALSDVLKQLKRKKTL